MRRISLRFCLLAAVLTALLVKKVSPGFLGAGQRDSRNLQLRRLSASAADDQASEWRLDLGHAIDVLRRDVPAMINSYSYEPDYAIFSQDVIFEDARLPSFRLEGLEAYKTTIDMFRWSLRAACDRHKMQVMSISPPLNGVIYMRWRLQVWPKDPLGPAKDFFSRETWSWHSLPLYGYGAASEPTIIDGYSTYEIDPWTAKIVKHAIEITNPPTLLRDLLAGRLPSFQLGSRMPQVMSLPTLELPRAR